jgi:hypothetical protein
MRNISSLNSNLTYKDSKKPLFRGINKNYVNMDDYIINRVHYWPAFSSTSKSESVAIKMSRRANSDARSLIFRIYVN